MNKFSKAAMGVGIAASLVGLLLGGAYAVGSNPGTTFQPGVLRKTSITLADTFAAFQQLGGISNSGAFGVPMAAQASLHNYVQMYGHQPYTMPTDPFDQ